MEDNGAGTDNRALANLGAGEHDRTNPDMRKRVHRHAASQEHSWRKMDVIADQAVMLDNGSRVHNAVLSDLSIRVDHDFRHDDGAGPKSRRL
jgi:hypothetical protein